MRKLHVQRDYTTMQTEKEIVVPRQSTCNCIPALYYGSIIPSVLALWSWFLFLTANNYLFQWDYSSPTVYSSNFNGGSLFWWFSGIASVAFVMGMLSFLWMLFPFTTPQLYNNNTHNCSCFHGYCNWSWGTYLFERASWELAGGVTV